MKRETCKLVTEPIRGPRRMSDAKQIGQRFSHVYLQKDELLQDSPRARRRISAWLVTQRDADRLTHFLISELGVELYYGIEIALRDFTKPDFLDSITLIYKYFTQKRGSPIGSYNPKANEQFLESCRRIFSEESLSYEIDDAGGVHYKVDGEFAANTNATIASIGGSRYGNVRAEFEKGMAALSSATPDGKEAIRGVFGAAECLYKLIVTSAPRLTFADVKKNLPSISQSLYSSDPTAQRAASKMIDSFASWVDACHNYRHEQGVEEPSQPPLDLAIEMVSAGSGFVRWLVRFDKSVSP